VTSHPPKVGQVVVDPIADLVGQKAELPHLAGGGADQTELQLKCNVAVTW
jgi:hypothetical protein